VLSTMFAFYYVHSGRSANTDAVYTLLIVLTVLTLWAARDARWRLLWLGAVLAAVFLLRGMAIIVPVVMAVVYAAWSRQLRRDRLGPALGALVLCAVPVGVWFVARWQFDGWAFIGRLFWYDFVARATTNIEDHPGSVFYYLDVLQRHHYDWLIAALLVWILFPVGRERLRALGTALRTGSGPLPLLAVWAAVTFGIPTLMSTKLAWYLNPFYPVFALGVGALFAHAVAAAGAPTTEKWRRVALAVVIVLAAGVAEGKLIWYSFHHRDLASSSQGLLIAERDTLKGRQVFSARWDRSEIFVTEALVGATYKLAHDVDDFLGLSQPGDCFLSPAMLENPRVVLAGSTRRAYLYRRVE